MEGVDWIDLAQGRDRRQTLVNTGINLWVPKNVGNFLTSKDLLATQEVLFST